MSSRKFIENVDLAADFLSLLGNSKRLVIMSHLLEGELSVGAIAEKVALSQSALEEIYGSRDARLNRANGENRAAERSVS